MNGTFRFSGAAWIVVSLAVIALPCGTAHGQWVMNGTVVREMVNAQYPPRIVPDGSGGAIIAWKDFRYGGWDLFAQRIDRNGVLRWETGGAPVCTESGSQHWIRLVSDGAGGAIAVWMDLRRDWDICAQHIGALGESMWKSNGNGVCITPGQKTCLVSTADGLGGAVAAWIDMRGGAKELYAQRVNGEGAVLWGRSGLAVCPVPGTQWHPEIAPDGEGGAIIVWQDRREAGWDIYAQRVSGRGELLWDRSGVAVSTLPADEFFPVLGHDGAGGVFVAWYMRRSGGDRDVLAQRLDATGGTVWPGGGVPVGSGTGDQMKPRIVSVGGDVVVTWVDGRGGNRDIFAQRISPEGIARWNANGIGVCTDGEDQWAPSVVPDGEGGVVIAWHDMRNDYRDIYAQRIDAEGERRWIGNGAAVCTAVEPQVFPQLVADGTGGAIIVWLDLRKDDYSADIYAARIDGEGVTATGTGAGETAE